MQCTCPECEIWMGEMDRGLSSECKCPLCGRTCNVCLGTNCVMSIEDIRTNAGVWVREDNDE